MVLYVERADITADTVFWCGHREFDETDLSDVGPVDRLILMAAGTVAVACPDCWLTLATLLLPNGLYLPGGGSSVSFWCGHRDWIDGIGQPAPGDRTITIKALVEAYLVGCPECAEQFALQIAEKAIRLRFENHENLEEMIEED